MTSSVVEKSSKVSPCSPTPDGVEPSSKTRWQRLMSVGSISVDGRQQAADSIVMDRTGGFRRLAKMLCVVAIPVVALIVQV